MHILLVTRHYPPEVSGGARRPYLLTKQLRLLGHKVTLVTPFDLDDDDHICVPSEAIARGVSSLHSKTGTHPNPILNNLKNTARVWFYWPDPDIKWCKTVVRKVVDSNIQPDWIMTTSPPESVHYVGTKLKSILNIPWIAELRDTWIEFPHRKILEKSKFRALIERKIAKKTLMSAQAVAAVSEAVMSEARKYVLPNTPELILSHFSDFPTEKYSFSKDKLHLLHSGGFTQSDRRRKLEPLLEALRKVHQHRPNLVLHITGPLTKNEKGIVKSSPFPIKLYGSVPLKKSRAMQAGADGLILYSPQNSHALPGKYAEYNLVGRPILTFGGGEWTSLVNEQSFLRPLVEGAINLKKQEVVEIDFELSIETAASKLLTFLTNNH